MHSRRGLFAILAGAPVAAAASLGGQSAPAAPMVRGWARDMRAAVLHPDESVVSIDVTGAGVTPESFAAALEQHSEQILRMVKRAMERNPSSRPAY